MTFSDGDKFIYENTEYEVTGISNNTVWAKSSQEGYSYTNFVRLMSIDELTKAHKDGRLIKLNKDTLNTDCRHTWQKYIGFNEVYHFCTKCSSKQFIPWRDLT